MPFAFHYAARSDVGMVRSNNEDSGYAGPHLLAMADGMGGHAGGDVASSTVVAALVALDGESLSGRDASQALLDRIHEANREIGGAVDDDPRLDGMGTTLIAMLRTGDRIALAHIGDSRAFMLRDGEVTQVTKDHSFVQNLVDEGRITADEAKTHPQRSLVTRVLTGNDDDEPDLVVRQGRAGDRYLIASDGLTDYVARDTIDEVLREAREPGECAERLVALALRAGAPDNVTVIVGDLVDIAKVDAPPTQPQVVGAAAERRRATRPVPVTPAEKAAALTKSATGADDADDEGVTLAEEGPRTRRGIVLRVVAALVVTLVVLAGGSYAAYAWSQQQYYLGEQDGVVTVFRGVDQDLGPISLHAPEYATTIPVDELPDSYQQNIEAGIEASSRADADVRVAELRLQAEACRYARSQGDECRTVEPGWTPPSPSPSPSGSASSSASPSPSASPSASSSGLPSSTPTLPPPA
ncbi:PP2C family serine/threonine-protein phosphatase [Arthrobacter sp. NEB 688]|uniref:PP2C family protein-serine/threonine phosphatase n=1 Tax=Arthrobacter sp. NEB 688 TaxID=904039 RepID=UPI0015635FA0|nr:PP2C family serine/threonine-protein phosphatase [Arthrobacter sp. NEB 688]QKE83175.1 serine/threonine-protein phosphatase [Arthrobacter sp. NEB 688]